MDDRENTWQMPQGGIDRYENPLVAAVRELKEETGITSVDIIGSLDQWLTYEMATKVKCDTTGQVIRYRGQTQKWMLLHFHGNDDEIDISCHGIPEFSEWRWMNLEDLPHSVVDFKKGVYKAVAGHFAPHIRRLSGQGNIVSKFPATSSAAVVGTSKLVN
jgi:putative (di)nucleoside polyphosphate hydrolase